MGTITIEEAIQQVESEIAPLIGRGYSTADALTIFDRAERLVANEVLIERQERRQSEREALLTPASP